MKVGDLRHEGRVALWNSDRGFGFIVVGQKRRIFLHASDVSGVPQVGDTVRFELEDGLRGQRAVRASIERRD